MGDGILTKLQLGEIKQHLSLKGGFLVPANRANNGNTLFKPHIQKARFTNGLMVYFWKISREIRLPSGFYHSYSGNQLEYRNFG